MAVKEMGLRLLSGCRFEPQVATALATLEQEAKHDSLQSEKEQKEKKHTLYTTLDETCSMSEIQCIGYSEVFACKAARTCSGWLCRLTGRRSGPFCVEAVSLCGFPPTVERHAGN